MLEINDNILELRNRINRPFVINGAIGSELQNMGLTSDNELWSAVTIIDHSDELFTLYENYLTVGSDILITNTFRTNPVTLNNSIYKSEELIKKNIELLQQLKKNYNFITAGSNPPAEDCYKPIRTLSQKDLETNHRNHITSLKKYGSEIIFNETISHFDEIKIICKILGSQEEPFVLSLFSPDGINILSGESLKEVIEFIYKYNNVILSLNCIKPEQFKIAINLVDQKRPHGFYLNLGTGEFTDKKIKCSLSPSDYVNQIKKHINEQTFFIGSCCGSNYKHTRELRKYADSQN